MWMVFVYKTSKKSGTTTHTYILDGVKILKETWGSRTLIPIYDNEDAVCGIVYNNEIWSDHEENNIIHLFKCFLDFLFYPIYDTFLSRSWFCNLCPVLIILFNYDNVLVLVDCWNIFGTQDLHIWWCFIIYVAQG